MRLRCAILSEMFSFLFQLFLFYFSISYFASFLLIFLIACGYGSSASCLHFHLSMCINLLILSRLIFISPQLLHASSSNMRSNVIHLATCLTCQCFFQISLWPLGDTANKAVLKSRNYHTTLFSAPSICNA